MAFRWFRKNKNTTRWLYIGVTVFVMVTFTVTGAMLDGLADESASSVAGSFKLPGGKPVEIGVNKFRRVSNQLARLGSKQAGDDQVWEFLMLDALAEDAGVTIDDRTHKEFQQSFFASAFQTDAEIRQWLRRVGMTPADFSELMRRRARIHIYSRMVDDVPPVLSEEIFQQFQKDHELLTVEYVAWSAAEEEEKLKSEIPDEAGLKKFYEEEMNAVTRANDFSTEPKYGLEAAVLEIGPFSLEELRERLPEAERAVTEEELKNAYSVDPHRFEIEDDGAEDPADADGTDEDGTDEDETDEDETDEAHRHRPLEEVKDLLEKEILVGRIVNKASNEYNVARVERERGKQTEDQAGEDPQGEPGEDEKPAGPEPEEEDLLAKMADRYGLELVDFGEPVTAEEIAGLDRIGSEELQRSVVYLSEGNVIPRAPTPDRPRGFLVRMSKRVASEPLPFEEVKDRLADVWVKETAASRAEELAREFRDAIKDKARALAGEEVTRLEDEARKTADQVIAADGVTDEAKKQEIIDRELEDIQPRIDKALLPFEGEAFGQLVSEGGQQLVAVPEYRKSYSRTRFFGDEEPSVARFVKGHTPVFALEEGAILGPLFDQQNSTHLVVRMVKRRAPELAEMRLKDRSDAEQAVLRDKDPNALYRQFAPGRFPNPELEYQQLSSRLQLVVNTPDAPPEKADENTDESAGEPTQETP